MPRRSNTRRRQGQQAPNSVTTRQQPVASPGHSGFRAHDGLDNGNGPLRAADSVGQKVAGRGVQRAPIRSATRGLQSTPIHPDDRLLTAGEAALLLRCTATQLKRWRNAGELASVRLGHRTVRYLLSDLGVFIATRRQPARTP